MDWVAVIGLVPVCAIAAILVRYAAKGPGDRGLDAFARAHGLALTEGNRPVVAHHVRRGQLYRTAGACLGVLSFAVYDAITSPAEGFSVNSVAPVVGYLLGAALAAIVILRPGDGPRSAMVTRRSLADYLPRRLLVLLRLPPLTSVLFAAGYAALGTPQLALSYSLRVAGLSLAVGIVLELLLAAVVRRRQPALSPDLLAADNAIRASSLYVLAAAGTAGQCLVLSSQFAGLVVLAGRETAPLAFVGWGGIIGLQLAGVVAWVVLGHPRRARRGRAREPVAP